MSNGYENRETWAYGLWLQNDEGLYRIMMDKIEELAKSGKDKDDILDEFRIYLKEFLEELKESLRGPESSTELFNMFDDIGSTWRINYDEIAKTYEEEIQDAISERA